MILTIFTIQFLQFNFKIEIDKILVSKFENLMTVLISSCHCLITKRLDFRMGYYNEI